MDDFEWTDCRTPIPLDDTGRVFYEGSVKYKPKPTCAKPSCGTRSTEANSLKRCTGCLFTYYCSQQCQKDDRKRHRSECRHLCSYSKLRHCNDCTATGCSTCTPCSKMKCLTKGFPRHCRSLCSNMANILEAIREAEADEIANFRQNNTISMGRPANDGTGRMIHDDIPGMGQ